MEKFLKMTNEETFERYLEFAKKVEKLLKEAYMEETIELPINLNLVARQLGLEIKFNGEWHNDYGTLKENKIMVNEELSYNDRRWAIAKAIVKYLSNDEKSSIRYSIRTSILVPYDIHEFELDIYATMILLPIFLLKKEIIKTWADYKEYKESIMRTEWFGHLIEISQMPNLQFYVGYQAIMEILCYQRQKKFHDLGYDVTKMPKDEWEEVFSIDTKLKKEYRNRYGYYSWDPTCAVNINL